jgi:hypothetical protein
VTWGFFYLVVLLGGFTLAIVTGLVRRLLHPTELCDDEVVAPSHDHWYSQHTPFSDLAVSFTALFGLTTFVVHGVAALDPVHEVAIGAAAGLVGVVVIRAWMGRIRDPIHQVEEHPDNATVVREIPPNGFGQVEVIVHGSRLKLAAKSSTGAPISPGTVVEILDRQESVVVVAPSPG